MPIQVTDPAPQHHDRFQGRPVFNTQSPWQVPAWSHKKRYIDKNAENGLVGVRLTNHAKLFDQATSIQILDAHTVSVNTGGFENKDWISLTEEDGRQFVAWLHTAHPELMPEETWQEILAPVVLEANPAAAAVTDAERAARQQEADVQAARIVTSKNTLVMWLAEHHPEQFGKWGKVTATSYTAAGGNFYDAVLDIFKTAGTLASQYVGIIHTVEADAHVLYHDAAVELQHAVSLYPDLSPELARIEAAKEAHAMVRAAEILRRNADALRKKLAMFYSDQLPPIQEFPEAITVEIEPPRCTRCEGTGSVVDEDQPANRASKLIQCPRCQGSGAKPEQQGPGSSSDKIRGQGPEDPTGPDPELFEPGDVVSVKDPTHPRFNQIGDVSEGVSGVSGGRIVVRFKDEPTRNWFFAPDQLQLLPS